MRQALTNATETNASRIFSLITEYPRCCDRSGWNSQRETELSFLIPLELPRMPFRVNRCQIGTFGRIVGYSETGQDGLCGPPFPVRNPLSATKCTPSRLLGDSSHKRASGDPAFIELRAGSMSTTFSMPHALGATAGVMVGSRQIRGLRAGFRH